MDQLLLAAKAFADRTRVRVLAALRNQELCVCELCDALGVTQSTLSTHLQVIKDAGLVGTRKEGKWIYYALTPQVKRFIFVLFGAYDKDLDNDKQLTTDSRRLAKRLAERDNGACCRGFGAK
jgi:ArsR family transcriptional regulator